MPKLDTELKAQSVVRMPTWMADSVEAAALKNRVTASHIVRWAVEDWLERNGHQTPLAEIA